jgi:hypothetical protein
MKAGELLLHAWYPAQVNSKDIADASHAPTASATKATAIEY